MKVRSLITVAVITIFILTLSLPAFARISHSVTYEFEGQIKLERYIIIGESGTAHSVKIEGDGALERTSDVSVINNRVVVEETNDFSTAENALRNLTVTSVIDFGNSSKITCTESERIVEQVWAVQVGSKPGHSGELNQDFVLISSPNHVLEIDQVIATTEGEIKRYIDVKSCYSDECLYENLSLIGRGRLSEKIKLEVASSWLGLF